MVFERLVEIDVHSLDDKRVDIIRALLRDRREKSGRRADADAEKSDFFDPEIVVEHPAPLEDIAVFTVAERGDFAVRVAVGAVVYHEDGTTRLSQRLGEKV